jgi:hypothetical protein
VNLGRIKSLSSSKPKEANNNKEELRVEQMHRDLKAHIDAMRSLAKGALTWLQTVSTLLDAMHTCARGFARVIGLDEGCSSEAFDTLLNVLDEQLSPFCLDTSHEVNDMLIVALAKLVQTTENPLCLFDAMDSWESLHHLPHLLV